MSRKLRIEELLNQNLNPLYLKVEDESGNHHVPEGAQTHFKLIVAAEQFNGLTRIARHRMINQMLHSEFEQGLHALSMHLYSIEEWQKHPEFIPSPNCRDGFNQ